MSNRKSSQPHWRSRLAMLAVLALSAGMANADQPATLEASQGAVRKSEVVIEALNKMAITANPKGKRGALPDLSHLHSQSVLIQDANTGETLYERNAGLVTPIASITKLMTAMVVLDRGLPMGEHLTISEEDMDALKFTRSRLKPGATLTREELILLALMSSENRAANALGRYYPGGLPAFVQAMNRKAQEIGMNETRANPQAYDAGARRRLRALSLELTGLSS